MIDGVVVTFADITGSKSLEAELREKQASLEGHIVEQDLRWAHAGSASRADASRVNREHGAADASQSAPEKGRKG